MKMFIYPSCDRSDTNTEGQEILRANFVSGELSDR